MDGKLNSTPDLFTGALGTGAGSEVGYGSEVESIKD